MLYALPFYVIWPRVDYHVALFTDVCVASLVPFARPLIGHSVVNTETVNHVSADFHNGSQLFTNWRFLHT